MPLLRRLLAKARSLRVGRWAVRGLAALVGVYVAYLAVANAVLSTDRGRELLNQIDHEHVRIDFESAYTVWFGRVHAKHLVMRGEDSSVEWRMAFDDVSASVSPLPLFARQLRLHDAQTRGVEVRIRFKVDAKDATTDRLAGLPPIEGLADPPLRPAVMPPDLSDADYNLWTVDLVDVVADEVREIWVESIHATGSGHVEGGLFFQPLRRIEIRPTQVQLEGVAFSVATRPVASEISASFTATMRSFDPRESRGRELLHELDVSVTGTGVLADLHPIEPVLAPSGIHITGGGGPLVLAVDIKHGMLLPRSHIIVKANDWLAAIGDDHSVGGSAVAEMYVSSATPPLLTATLAAYGVFFHHRNTEVATAPTLSLLGTTTSVDLTAEFEDGPASIDVPEAKVKDLRAFNSYPGLPRLSAGSAAVSLHLDLTRHRMNGHVLANAFDPTLVLDKNAIHARTAMMEAKWTNFDLDNGSGNISTLRAEVTDASFAAERGWWMKGTGTPAHLSFAGGPSFVTHIQGQMRDGRLPMLVLGAPGIIMGAIGTNPFTVSADVHATVNVVEMTHVHMAGSDLDVVAHHRTTGAGKSGAGLVRSKFPNVGFEIGNDGISVKPFASADWYAHTGS